MYLEGLPDEIVDKVDLRTAHVRQRNRVDQHHRAVTLDNDVIVGARAIQIEAILEAGATASRNADAQSRAARFASKNPRYAPCRALGNGNAANRLFGHRPEAKKRCVTGTYRTP